MMTGDPVGFRRGDCSETAGSNKGGQGKGAYTNGGGCRKILSRHLYDSPPGRGGGGHAMRCAMGRQGRPGREEQEEH